jgi:hypothetical protein
MKTFQYLLEVCLYVGTCCYAQDAVAPKPSEIPTVASSVAALEFSKPKVVEDLDAGPSVAGRFDCSNDGSIYALINGYALNRGTNERLALLAIHPDGTVTSFAWRSVPGFTDISLPKSIFVGNGRVYVLVTGESKSVKRGYISDYPLVLAFDESGALISTVVLEQDLKPLVLGVFPSGNIVLVSEDRLNHRMALNLVGTDGTPLKEMRLYDNDFLVNASRMPAAAHGTSNYSPLLLISMSKFFASDNHLLLVPLETSGLPIVEIDEHGVLHSVIPHLPENMVLEAFLSSSGSSFTVRLGKLIESDKEIVDSQGKVLGVATRPSERITELSRTDGSLLREIDIGGPGVQPACENNGTFRFLTSNAQRGLQVVTAEAR